MRDLTRSNIRPFLKMFFLLLCLLITVNIFVYEPIYAAPSASASISKSSVLTGETFTVTFTFKNSERLGAVQGDIVYDKNIVELIPNDFVNSDHFVTVDTNIGTQFVLQVSFKPKKVGSTQITATTDELATSTGDLLPNVKASTTITVRNVSTNADLRALSVNPGTLRFAAATTSYTVNLASTVKSISVSATAADSRAKITGTGNYTLKAGESKTIPVKVTAENGTTVKTYNIIVKVAAATPRPSTPKPSTPKPSSNTSQPSGSISQPASSSVTSSAATPSDSQALPSGSGSAETSSSQTPENSGNVSVSQEGSPSQTPGVTSTQSSLIKNTGDNGQDGDGIIFSTKAAFIICALGMFTIGTSVGFMVCYIIKSKGINAKSKNNSVDKEGEYNEDI